VKRGVALGLVATIGVVLIVVVIVGAWWGYNSVTCDLRWPDHENEWRPWSGCQVVTSQGRVPEERFRVTD
jgi:hypothetical protein